MSKFHGKIGFVKTIEKSPGVYMDQVTERDYHGDILRNNRRWQTSDKINEDLTMDEQISITADSYILEELQFLKYVNYMGVNWKVVTITPKRPRLLLTLGGIYNNAE